VFDNAGKGFITLMVLVGMLLWHVLSNIRLDSYLQRLVPTNVHNELDIGPDELIQLVPSFQSMCLVMQEKDSAL
jgi:hypothetical protein